MAESVGNDYPEVYFKLGSCNIILKKGDLMNENDVDVIVIPTPENGKQYDQNYPLFRALCTKANSDLKKEISQITSGMKRGETPQIIMDASPSIILTTTPYFQNKAAAIRMLRDTYRRCFNCASAANCQTIAFPTIGCGESGFSTYDAAQTIYDSLAQFGQSTNKQFKEIRIIIFKEEIYKEFIPIFIDLGSKGNAKIKFTGMSSEKPKTSEMPPEGDRQPAPRRDPKKEDTSKYDDDWEDDEGRGSRRNPVTPKTSNLNPNIPEFRPRQATSNRILRRYYINNKNKNTKLHILQGDILQEKVDAIVNATNESMKGKGGIDGAIHKAAGDELLGACNIHKKIRPGVLLPTGRSRILLSYKMSSTTDYIINTASPHFDQYSTSEEAKKRLISCYKTSLALANLYQLKTISFPAISCGENGFPLDKAAEVALTTVDQNANSLKTILFVLKDDDTYDAWVKIARKLSFISMDGDDSAMPSTPKTPGEHVDVRDASKKSAIRKEIDEPASDDTPESVECTTDQPTTDAKTKDAPKDEKSVKTNDGDVRMGAASNSSSRGRGAQKKDQTPNNQPIHKSTNPSIAPGGRGRGKTN